MKKEKKAEQPKPVPIAQAEQKSARASLMHVRVSPRKVRLVIDVIRRKPAVQAFRLLMGFKQKAARITEKLLKTAVANAKVLGMDEAKLYVAEVRADGGPTMKRFMSRSMGRADRILKRTTHILLIVKEGGTSYGKPDSPFAAKAKKDKAEKTSAKS